ncbi:MAG: DUF4342 domain-containing protein [Firmicutes bacterium]|nr:DUF4342 domain-containing protein [Clostridiales bacterium]MBQ9932017.1 DUF4342 domain-containing protein [Bacillota bacterium]
MEITLEKIELVRDRTGVSYKEAKDALEASGGSVVDAIIAIEEKIDMRPRGFGMDSSMDLVDRAKEILRKGNVSRIMVKKDGNMILNLSVNIGLAGALIAPWAAIAAVVAACGTRCRIEFLKEDGEIVEVSEIAMDAFEDMKERGSVVMDEVKSKGSEVFNNVKAKATEAMGRAQRETDSGIYYSDVTCDYAEDDFDCDLGACGCNDDSCEK